MSKFPEVLVAAGLIAGAGMPALAQGDAEAGERVFKKCAACHAVGEGASNKVGPHLNDVIGRIAGSLPDYKYSPAMSEAGSSGLVWADEALDAFLANPREVVNGTKMTFAGLRKEEERRDVIAYLATFSEGGADAAGEAQAAPSDTPETVPDTTAMAEATPEQPVPQQPSGGPLDLGRPATETEIAAWNIDVRPDGTGLPVGRGTVADGEVLFTEVCASCHGDFGEGRDRWPVLAGGFDTLARQRPEKTVGSYWPYLSTVFDYVHRAMPFGNARSLSPDEVYALTAYILYLNDIVTDEEFELSSDNFTEIVMPNVDGFIPDNRASEEHYVESAGDPCMSECKADPVEITMRAQVLDVTPDATAGDAEGPAGGSVD